MPLQRTSFVVALAVCLAIPAFASPGRQMTITTSSEEARQLYMQAVDKAENLELEAAGRLAEQAIAKDPGFAMAYLLRGQAGGGFVVFRENLDKAVSLIDKVSPGERHWIMAAKAQSDGDMTALKALLDQLAQAFPEDKHVQLRLARHHRGPMQDIRQAVVHYRKATSIDPSYAAAYNELGYALADLEDHKGAETAFQKYIALRPASPNPYDSYAEFLMRTGRYDESIAQYRKALEKDPAFVSALAGIGNNQVFKGEFEEARRTFDQQRAKSPDLDAQLNALENVAISYVHEGKPAEAVRVYEDIARRAQAGQLAPRVVNAHVDAAFVLTQGGDAAAAGAQVDKASSSLNAASLPQPVKERMGRQVTLARARVLATQGKPEAAVAEIEKVRPAIEGRGVPGELRALSEVQGTVALKQKKYREALAYFEKAGDQNPYAIYQRAVAAGRLGQQQLAMSLLDKVANWNVNDLGYAMVRQGATDKAAAVAVATSGKKRP